MMVGRGGRRRVKADSVLLCGLGEKLSLYLYRRA